MVSKRKRSTIVRAVDREGALQASISDEITTEYVSEPETEQEEEDDNDEFIPAQVVIKRKVPSSKKKKATKKDEETEDEEPRQRAPATNSDYVPIPWKGRIGYACLNTYLRASFPPIFCSRTCRIDTILKQGQWKTSGLSFVHSLGLANAKDLIKIIHWNEKYGIKFLRISSEMFPFASHKKYGYNLDFAKDILQEAGRVAMQYGHRLDTHPGQFTQLGSPRLEVIKASVMDLEYQSELLRGLKLEGQADRDAVMVLHMGGMFGDKQATLDRFRKNYTMLLSDDIKARLVLENDDVIWSVHDLLPICKELNIPLVLDYHHHNIIHDPLVREGTFDVIQLFPEIKETWTRKGITQKQHYSEPCVGAFTGREMRKHSPRVATLPPCDDTMDLMIEAKDKEQAVFELYKKYGIGGDGLFRDVIPHERTDENRPKRLVKKTGKQDYPEEQVAKPLVPDDEVGMGGPERRVYWPEGKEEWLRPAKRTVKKKLKPEGEVT